jgi:SpoU rRNA methylase family enzyme
MRGAVFLAVTCKEVVFEFHSVVSKETLDMMSKLSVEKGVELFVAIEHEGQN